MRRREKPFLALKEYRTVMFAMSQPHFFLPPHSAQTKTAVKTSLLLSAVSYWIMHPQYLAWINLNLNFELMLVSPSFKFSLEAGVHFNFPRDRIPGTRLNGKKRPPNMLQLASIRDVLHGVFHIILRQLMEYYLGGKEYSLGVSHSRS